MKNYYAGRVIKTIKSFDHCLEHGTLLYIKNWKKTAHPIILANMQYRILKQFIECGEVTIAKKIRRR